jgi:hypothetical protein
MSRDVLSEINAGTMTVDDAYDILDALLDSAESSGYGYKLGLSHRELTAFVHSVGFAELARWRRDGWPQVCRLCGEPIDHDAFGWLARENGDGTHHIVHIRCLPGGTSMRPGSGGDPRSRRN